MKTETPFAADAAAVAAVAPLAPSPWWRFRIVWLVFGLPSLAVAASLLTFGIAWHGADIPVRETARADSALPTSLQPAVQARNHAAAPR